MATSNGQVGALDRLSGATGTVESSNKTPDEEGLRPLPLCRPRASEVRISYVGSRGCLCGRGRGRGIPHRCWSTPAWLHNPQTSAGLHSGLQTLERGRHRVRQPPPQPWCTAGGALGRSLQTLRFPKSRGARPAVGWDTMCCVMSVPTTMEEVRPLWWWWWWWWTNTRMQRSPVLHPRSSKCGPRGRLVGPGYVLPLLPLPAAQPTSCLRIVSSPISRLSTAWCHAVVPYSRKMVAHSPPYTAPLSRPPATQMPGGTWVLWAWDQLRNTPTATDIRSISQIELDSTRCRLLFKNLIRRGIQMNQTVGEETIVATPSEVKGV
jgi:hypothetical protein